MRLFCCSIYELTLGFNLSRDPERGFLNMRPIILILLGLSSTAQAHTPDGDVLVSLTHTLTSPHHLTFAVIAVVAGVILFRRRVANRTKTRRDR